MLKAQIDYEPFTTVFTRVPLQVSVFSVKDTMFHNITRKALRARARSDRINRDFFLDLNA